MVEGFRVYLKTLIIRLSGEPSSWTVRHATMCTDVRTKGWFHFYSVYISMQFNG